MKKNFTTKVNVRLSKFKQLFNLLGLSIILITVMLPKAAYSMQESKITLVLNNVTIKEIIEEIKSQTEYSFFVDAEDVKLNKKISVNLENRSINDVLDTIIEEGGLTYTISNSRITLTSVKNKPKASSSTKVKQNDVVSGTVLTAAGEPISGVTVVVKGTTIGNLTNLEGQYSLNNVPLGSVVQFIFFGLKTQDVKFTGKPTIDVVMQESALNLDEVVIVGYGSQKKINLTGSVATVSASDVVDRGVTSVSASLQGLVPGMTVVQSSGAPGADSGTIRIRGVGTLNNSSPLILVDGIEGSMDNLDVNEIESFSVLKDAASASIYGSKAANGVILISTKRGKKGDFTVNYSSNIGWQSANERPEYLNSADYATLYNTALSYNDKDPRFTNEEIQKFRDGSDPYNYPDTDWLGLFYVGSGFQHTHNINMSGGSDKATYMSSIGFQDQKGIIDHTGNKKFNFRTNVDYKISEKLLISANISYVNSEVEEPTNPYVGGQTAIINEVNSISPWVPYKNEDGTYGTIPNGNPIAWMDLGGTTNWTHHTLTNLASISYDITDDLVIKAQGSYRANLDSSTEFRKDIQYNPNKYHGPNLMQLNNSETTMMTSDITLNYDKKVGNHTIGVLAGFHTEEWMYQTTYAYRQGFPNNNMTDINAGSTDGQKNSGYSRDNAMVSWFGRLNYDYAGKYLFEANVRADASSRFAKGHRWGYFPSFSGAWRVSEEKFMESSRDILTNMKVRGSWGMLGNQNIGDYYPALPTIGLGYDYAFGDKVYSGAFQNDAKLEAVSWESTRTWGVGLDFNIKQSISVSLDYYSRLTSGILMEVEAPASFGRKGYIDNIGEVSNTGFEAVINWNKKYNDFVFDVGANFAYNNNEILNLGKDERIIDKLMIKQVNSPINSFYGYVSDGLFQSQEEIDAYPEYKMSGHTVMPGDIKYKDINGDGEITDEDRVVLGSQDPKFTFGLNLSAAWKGISVSASFQGVAGVSGYLREAATGQFAGETTKPSSIWLDSWTPQNTDAAYPRVTEGNTGVSLPGTVYSSFWEQNAAYLRLKNVQVGYTFPEALTKKMKLNRLRIYYSGTNLFTITDFLTGWDPEAPVGYGAYYPQVSVHSLGINITF